MGCAEDAKVEGTGFIDVELGFKVQREMGNVERESLQTASEGSRTLLPSPQMRLTKPQNPNPGP